MQVEFIGMIGTQESSEVLAPAGPLVDPDFTARFARAHEDGGFDRILIGYGSRWPDGWQVANHAVRATERLKILLAHRPGFVAPTLTARQAATFEHLTGAGRLALHIITGGDEADQRREGDFLSHDERYRRTAEYLDLLRQLWTSTEPIDFDGEFYRVEDALLPGPTGEPSGIPIFFGGASDAALDVGARYADVYMLWGEPLAAAGERLRAIRAAAARVRSNVALQPLGATDPGADRSRRLGARRGHCRTRRRPARPVSECSRTTQQLLRGLRAAARSRRRGGGPRHPTVDAALPPSPARPATRPRSSGRPSKLPKRCWRTSTSGFDTLLIRGFHPLQDAIDYGRELIPLVRAGAARRESSRGSPVA